MKLPPGVRRHGAGFQAVVKVRGQRVFQSFPADTPMQTIKDWRDVTRGRLVQDRRREETMRATLALQQWPTLPPVPCAAGLDYVYVIQAGRFVKIGRSQNPHARMADLQGAHPVELRMVAILPCAAAVDTELRLHERFAERRTRGEWFELDFALVGFIDRARLGVETEASIAQIRRPVEAARAY